MSIDKDKIIYDLALICVKQCLNATSPSDMDEAADYAVKAFEKAYVKISKSIQPVIENINTL